STPRAGTTAGAASIASVAPPDIVDGHSLGKMPGILTRAGFTLVDAKADKLLRRYGLCVEDVWAGSQGLRHKMERQSVPGSLSKTFERNQKQIAKMLTELGRQIQKLDPTLKGTVERARKRIEYHIDKLRRKAGREEDQKTGLLSEHERYLEAPLYPHKGPQERELCLLPFLARWGAGGLT